MQDSGVGDDNIDAPEDVGKRVSAMVNKYKTSEKDIIAMISLGLYTESQKPPYNSFSIIKNLLAALKFEYSSDMYGDGSISITPFLDVFKMETHYNCCGLNMCTMTERVKTEKTAKKYEKEVARYRKPVALGERARRKPKTPNFLKDIEYGVLVCSNSEDLTFSVRFLKPQDGVVTEERILKDYCGEHACPMRNDFGENRKVHYIDGADFIKTAGRIIEERDTSGGRIFSDVDNLVKYLLKKFPPQKTEAPPEIA